MEKDSSDQNKLCTPEDNRCLQMLRLMQHYLDISIALFSIFNYEHITLMAIITILMFKQP
jgi:hypothetical protein